MLVGIPYGNKNYVKDLVVSVLSINWPLKIKQIHNYLKRDFECNKSYQAVYKAILELNENSVLTETENGWQLSTEWVNKNYNFFHKLKDSHKNNLFSSSISSEPNITTMNFKNLMELDKFYFDIFENIIPSLKEKTVIFYSFHNWRPLLYSQREYTSLTQTVKQYYFLCGGDTPLDTWCAEFEKKCGANIKTGIDFSSVCDIYVIGDLIIQVYISKETMNLLNTIFNSSDNISNIDINHLIKNVFEKISKIVVVITKNDDIARQIRHKALEIFNQDLSIPKS